MMKTYSPKPEHIERSWYVMDASGQVLGRLASEVATLLRGKHKPIFAPHMDTGDHVVVINADKVELSGNKAQDKFAYRHSGYPGGITGIRYADLARCGCREGRPGHAPEEPSRSAADQEAPRRCGGRASARGADARRTGRRPTPGLVGATCREARARCEEPDGDNGATFARAGGRGGVRRPVDDGEGTPREVRRPEVERPEVEREEACRGETGSQGTSGGDVRREEVDRLEDIGEEDFGHEADGEEARSQEDDREEARGEEACEDRGVIVPWP